MTSESESVVGEPSFGGEDNVFQEEKDMYAEKYDSSEEENEIEDNTGETIFSESIETPTTNNLVMHTSLEKYNGSNKKENSAASVKEEPSIKKLYQNDGKRNSSGKPTYINLAHNAIATLKDRTGSSLPAILKLIKAQHKHVLSIKPENFKKLVNNAIKQGLREKRFVQVKNSFKINSEWNRKQKAAMKANEAAKKKAEIQREKNSEILRIKKAEDDNKKRIEEDKIRKENEKTLEERAAEAKAKLKAEILRRRRYPMEDTKMHEENKEYGIITKENVTKCPVLPYTLSCLVPPSLRNENQKSIAIFNASASGNGDFLKGEYDRGIIADTLQVYHFFCGDVGFVDEKYPVPKFSIKTLLYAVDEILNGNAKAAKCLPPLISHLFLTSLRVITSPNIVEESSETKTGEVDPVSVQIQKDIIKLGDGLNAVSWSQVLFFYMDLMERYYSSDASLEEGVMSGDAFLDMSYLWNGDTSSAEFTTKGLSTGRASSNSYCAYLGNPKGILSKAFSKLGNQVESWNLTAEELMALLRALTDDILSKRADLSADITERGAKLYELQKAKTQALIKYRKVKLAFEGPKKPLCKKKNDDDMNTADDEKPNEEFNEKTDRKSDDKPFQPTATKQQYLAAERAYNKATEALDNGFRKLISRTEPLAFDRFFNAYYCFTHDPEMMHVEHLKHSSLPREFKALGLHLNPFSSWHFIDTKSLYDQFLECLDTHGIRENELHETCSNLTILKRRLLCDKKENQRATIRFREREELERRLENARNACECDDGRRSGRLVGHAIDELKKVEVDFDLMMSAHKEEERLEMVGRSRSSDYSLRTGLQLVTGNNTVKHESVSLIDVPCHRLWSDPKIEGNGTVQVLVDALLDLEEECNNLSPWRRVDITRTAWRDQLSNASKSWAQECTMQLGPPCASHIKFEEASIGHAEDMTPASKKHKVESITGKDRIFVANVVSIIRSCLKELELRVFELSGEMLAFEEAISGDDSIASDEENSKADTQRQCWKKKINTLNFIPTNRYVVIRDIIVAAITVARKSHLNQVAADLKAALQLHRRGAAAEAKNAALGVLEKYGGYDGKTISLNDVDFDEALAMDAEENKVSEEAEEPTVSSFLCDEVVMMSGCIGGDQNADQFDWKEALRGAKSISRLAIAAQCFVTKAEDIIYRVQEEKDALYSFLGITLNKKRGTKSNGTKLALDFSTPVWADCCVTDKLVKAKVKDLPWWPARVCEPYDSSLAQAILEGGHILVSFVGDSINYVVSKQNVSPFIDENEEDLDQYDTETVGKLKESISRAKSIWRRQNRSLIMPWSKKSEPQYIEEKKTAL